MTRERLCSGQAERAGGHLGVSEVSAWVWRLLRQGTWEPGQAADSQGSQGFCCPELLATDKAERNSHPLQELGLPWSLRIRTCRLERLPGPSVPPHGTGWTSWLQTQGWLWFLLADRLGPSQASILLGPGLCSPPVCTPSLVSMGRTLGLLETPNAPMDSELHLWVTSHLSLTPACLLRHALSACTSGGLSEAQRSGSQVAQW